MTFYIKSTTTNAIVQNKLTTSNDHPNKYDEVTHVTQNKYDNDVYDVCFSYLYTPTTSV